MTHPTTIAMLAGVLTLGAFAGAAFAQTKFDDARVLTPRPLHPSLGPTTSRIGLDFMAIGKNFSTNLPTGGSITLIGKNIDIGHFTAMRPNGSLDIAVGTVPPGQYAVKVTLVNVGKPVTLTLAEGINTKSCPLAAQPGYLNEQSCALPIPSDGRGFNVRVSHTGDPFSEVTLKLVEVMKER